MQNKKPFPGKKETEENIQSSKRERLSDKGSRVSGPQERREDEKSFNSSSSSRELAVWNPQPTTDCAFVSGARARAEQENPTKRKVFSSYRQNGWSKAALKPRPALPFLEIVAGFKLVSCRWLPFLAQVLLYPHKLSLIHPQQDQVLPLPDSNPTSFSSYPLLVSASYTRSVLPPLSFTGQTVCVRDAQWELLAEESRQSANGRRSAREKRRELG